MTERHFRGYSRIFIYGLALLVVASGFAVPVNASELGHYAPALPRNRDFVLPPDPGFYYVQYIVFYTTDTLKDRNGDSIDSIPVGPVTINVETDVDSWTIAPTFIYVTEKEFLGARYGFFVTPTFGNVSLQAALESDTNPSFGFDVDESGTGLGDLFVRPVWLGWNSGNVDLAAGYGVYVPIGKFDAGEADNVGLGMWTHEFQVAGNYYFDEQKGTALSLVATYEIHHNKEDVDIRPGSHISLNYGVSQYLPVNQEVIGELGLRGYAQWQVTEDKGSDALNKDVKDQVYGIGLEAGLAHIPWSAQLTFSWLHEFEAEDRFEGDFFTLTIAKSF
jgi:hypothetical protein